MTRRDERFYVEDEPGREINGHIYNNIGVTVFDQAQCSCGWTGNGYWDGADLAYDEWIRHANGEDVKVFE